MRCWIFLCNKSIEKAHKRFSIHSNNTLSRIWFQNCRQFSLHSFTLHSWNRESFNLSGKQSWSLRRWPLQVLFMLKNFQTRCSVDFSNMRLINSKCSYIRSSKILNASDTLCRSKLDGQQALYVNRGAIFATEMFSDL